MSNTVVIIPARYASSRYPGKPLMKIAGVSLVERVWKLAVAAHNKEDVYIATDDKRIADAVSDFGGKSIMTPVECQNGSERVMAAVNAMDETPEFAINLQGDAVRTPPWVIKDLILAIQENTNVDCATPVVRVDANGYDKFLEAKLAGDGNGVMAVFDENKKALFFSRSMIPLYRDSSDVNRHAYKHVGLYAYKVDSLKKYLSLPMGPLESAESLEQLRLLENGMDLLCVPVDYKGTTPCSIDTPEDSVEAERIISVEGELV